MLPVAWHLCRRVAQGSKVGLACLGLLAMSGRHACCLQAAQLHLLRRPGGGLLRGGAGTARTAAAAVAAAAAVSAVAPTAIVVSPVIVRRRRGLVFHHVDVRSLSLEEEIVIGSNNTPSSLIYISRFNHIGNFRPEIF